MTLITPAHMVVVKKEEKESLLRNFLAAALHQCGASPVKPVLRVLARCQASPVIKAVTCLQAELAAAGVEIRVLLAIVEQTGAAQAGLSIKGASVRHMADVRFQDAHEQLVIGQQSSWVGDAMRREPATRDSFEMHSGGCAVVAKRVASSFDKLWAIAAPGQPQIKEPVQPAMDMSAELAALPVEAASSPQVLTRH